MERDRRLAPGGHLARAHGAAVFHCLPHGTGQFLHRQGLFHIAYCLQLDGGFQIFLIRIGAHEDNNRIRLSCQQFFRHLDTVHTGHADICKYDIRMLPQACLQPVDPIVSQEYLGDPQAL